METHIAEAGKTSPSCYRKGNTRMLIEGDFECANGPWKGQRLFLSSSKCGHSIASTGWFEYKGERGRYIEDPLDGKLYWEKENHECPI